MKSTVDLLSSENRNPSTFRKTTLYKFIRTTTNTSSKNVIDSLGLAFLLTKDDIHTWDREIYCRIGMTHDST